MFHSTSNQCGIQAMSLGWLNFFLTHTRMHAHKQNDHDGKTQDGKCSCQEFLGSREEDGERPRELRGGGGQIPCKEKQSTQNYKNQRGLLRFEKVEGKENVVEREDDRKEGKAREKLGTCGCHRIIDLMDVC